MFLSRTARRIYLDGDSGLAHHVRIRMGNRQQCQVSVLALSAKEECFGVCQFSFKSSETRRRTEYYYRIHSIPSCFMASNTHDSRNYISVVVRIGHVLCGLQYHHLLVRFDFALRPT